jgi:hypothetical protein
MQNEVTFQVGLALSSVAHSGLRGAGGVLKIAGRVEAGVAGGEILAQEVGNMVLRRKGWSSSLGVWS